MHSYSESQVFAWTSLLLMLAIVGAVTGISGALGDWKDPGEKTIFVGTMMFAAFFMGLLGIAFFRYSVKVDSGILRFGYSFWNVQMPVTTIESAVAEELTFGRWWGQGWRIDGKQRIGYIAGFGSGVEVRLQSGRVYVLSCKNPEQLIAALDQ